MAQLDDPTLLDWIATALRERKCDSYVHWEPAAQQELERDAPLTYRAVNEALARAFAGGARPDIEIQKGGPFDGESRYVWRIKVTQVELYAKTHIELDHLKEPRLDIVRCHVGWY